MYYIRSLFNRRRELHSTDRKRKLILTGDSVWSLVVLYLCYYFTASAIYSTTGNLILLFKYLTKVCTKLKKLLPQSAIFKTSFF